MTYLPIFHSDNLARIASGHIATILADVDVKLLFQAWHISRTFIMII
jgi:hypothetical protein